ncbi:MAG: N-acetyltransferase DgcN [Steroidobacteraceae bacterium]
MQAPYLIFLGSEDNHGDAKTGAGIAYWRRESCLGQNRMPGCTVDLGLRNMSIDEAVDAGAKTLVVGIAPDGGRFSPTWFPRLVEALDKGLDVAAGLHERLRDIPDVSRMARARGRTLHDVRQPDRSFPVGTGAKRPGKRLLTVGTDCAVGKMYASLALESEMRRRGMKADFRATGQTGILIAGTGVSVDAVVSDFVSGASESLSPANDPDHWDLVEGQGSLFHPSYAAVTLGLVHGSQPDAMVLCHEAGRTHIQGVEGYPIPDLRACMEHYVKAARLTNPAAAFVGACFNTSGLPEAEAERFVKDAERTLGMPCCDPVRHGVGRIVDSLQAR